jgi:DNA polymerase sigma
MTDREKIIRWDFVDNSINELILRLNPSSEELKWDIHIISEIREILVKYFTENLKLFNADYFYP